MYLMANNYYLRKRIPDSEIIPQQFKLSELETAHLIHSMNDLFLNCGIRLNKISITDIYAHQSGNIDFVLDSIPDNSIALVCRFNQFDCEKCILYAIEKACEFADSNDLTLLIWGWYDDDFVLKSLMARINLNRKVICYNVSELAMPIEQHGNPYYFVITKDGTMVDFFTPDKMDPLLTDKYFNMIDMKWKSNDCQWY